MLKKNLLFLLLIPMFLCAAHKYDAYVDASEPEDLPERRPIIVLNTIENKRSEKLPETYRQNIEVSSGKIRTGTKFFQYIPEENLKTVFQNKEQVNLVLNELKDYFLKASADNTKILRLSYHLVDGKHLYIHLMRYLAGANVAKPEFKEIFINLSQLVATKQKEIESIQITVIVDGDKMEKSSVEAVPIFKEDTRDSQASPVRPSEYKRSQGTARS